MDNVNMEYCEYILSLDNENKEMLSGGAYKNILKDKFILDVQNDVKHSKKHKKKGIINDKFLISVIEEFIDSDLIWLKGKKDIDIEKIYNRMKSMLKNEKEKLHENIEISYDNIFEILSYMGILWTNAIACCKEEEKKVYLKTADINMTGIKSIIAAFMEEMLRGRKSEDVIEKVSNKILDSKAIICLPVVNIAVLPVIIMQLFGFAKVQVRLNYIFDIKYLFDILFATYTRNEELKGKMGYDW